MVGNLAAIVLAAVVTLPAAPIFVGIERCVALAANGAKGMHVARARINAGNLECEKLATINTDDLPEDFPSNLAIANKIDNAGVCPGGVDVGGTVEKWRTPNGLVVAFPCTNGGVYVFIVNLK
jgi:hypothetical protein